MPQENVMLPIGTIIRGREGAHYIIEDRLGRGGFSAVYLVRDRREKQKVYALKEMINPDKHQHSQFTFEAELLMRLEHKSLPRVYQIFENASLKRFYVLMDYIEGKDLETLRRQQPERCFDLKLTLTLLAPIVDAIRYLHAQNPPIVHRDIKPPNIIIPVKAGEAILVDFGLAKVYEEDQTTSILRFGSPGFAAPEQYGQGTSPLTDIYALGATLYLLLTGTIPIDATMRSVAKKGKDPLLSVDQLRPAIPESVAGVIDRAMALQSEERFSSIDEFWKKLQTEVEYSEAVISVDLASVPTFILSAQDIADITTRRTKMRKLAERVSRKRTLPYAALGLLLVMTIGIAFFASTFLTLYPQSNRSHRVSVPTVSITALSYPPIASSYAGTISDIGVAQRKTALLLTNIHQNQEKISGNFQGLGLVGPFTGTITQDGKVKFSVPLSAVTGTLNFQGNIKMGGEMVGTFTGVNWGGQNLEEYGDWSADAILS